jgi:hypothetical protein
MTTIISVCVCCEPVPDEYKQFLHGRYIMPEHHVGYCRHCIIGNEVQIVYRTMNIEFDRLFILNKLLNSAVYMHHSLCLRHHSPALCIDQGTDLCFQLSA